MADDEDLFFQRFRFPDADLAGVHRDIADDQSLAAAAAASPGGAPAVLAALVRLGFMLTPLDREAEAAAYLETALVMARELGERDQEIAVLLHLGTARQYLGQRDQAQALFQAGLDTSAEYGIDDQMHYLLHHRGRCYAEQGMPAEARDCFARALALRQRIGDPRFIASSQAALAALPPPDAD